MTKAQRSMQEKAEESRKHLAEIDTWLAEIDSVLPATTWDEKVAQLKANLDSAFTVAR